MENIIFPLKQIFSNRCTTYTGKGDLMTILEIYELGLKDRLSAAGCSKEDIESASRKCREDMKPFLEELHCLCELGTVKEPVDPILSGMISEKIKEFMLRMGMEDNESVLESERKRLQNEIDCLERTANSVGYKNPALDRIVAGKKDELEKIADLQKECG